MNEVESSALVEYTVHWWSQADCRYINNIIKKCYKRSEGKK